MNVQYVVALSKKQYAYTHILHYSLSLSPFHHHSNMTLANMILRYVCIFKRWAKIDPAFALRPSDPEINLRLLIPR